MTTIDDDMRSISQRQHAHVATYQIRALEGSRRQRAFRLDSADWARVTRRVVRLVGAPVTQYAPIMAAVLDAGPGAVASHRSASELWGLPGFRGSKPEVSRQRQGARPRQRPQLHEPRYLPPAHVTVIHDVPVTTPARTLFDDAAFLHPKRMEIVLDAALAISPGLIVALHHMLEELAVRGRPGITVMRELLAVRPLDYLAGASGLERRALKLADEAGVKIARQVNLGGTDWIGRFDGRLVSNGRPLEIDSIRHHTTITDKARDAQRDADARAAGFPDVLRITEEMIWSQPEEVKRILRRESLRLCPKNDT